MTNTPTIVLALARELAEAILDNLGGQVTQVHFAPWPPALAVWFLNRSGQTIFLSITPQGDFDYLLEYSGIYWRYTTKESIAVAVPDELEALHLLGIIVGAVGAKVTRLIPPRWEENDEVRAWAGSDGSRPDRVALCDHVFRLPKPGRTQGEVNCHFEGGGCFTPTEVFNWASQVVATVRSNLKGKIITAHLYGFRRTVQRGTLSPHSRIVTRDRYEDLPHLLVALTDEHESYIAIRFAKMAAYNFMHLSPDVPSLLEALHLTEMVLHTLGATISCVGSQVLEVNAEVLAVPVEGRYGRMTRALNFVSPQVDRYD